MKTVGFNISHDGAICICNNGEIEYYLEEERVSGYKHDGFPAKAFHKLFGYETTAKQLEEYEYAFSGLRYWPVVDRAIQMKLEFEQAVSAYINHVILKSIGRSKENEKRKLTETKFSHGRYEEHHVFHAIGGFYNSGFDDALVLIVDGMGNPSTKESDMHEVASLYSIQKDPFRLECLAKQETPKHHSEQIMLRDTHKEHWPMGIGMAYAAVSAYLGFGTLGSGKTMGLAPYGKEDKNIKPFVLDNDLVNSKLFYRVHDGCVFIPYDYLPEEWDFKVWDEGAQRLANLAYRLQKDFEKWMINTITLGLKQTGKKNLVISGGCALNCVANYEYLKHLPKGVKMFVDPLCQDAGTSVGLAKYLYYCKQ